MREIKFKACENCKNYEKNYRCKIFSLKNVHQVTNVHQACQFWEGIPIVKEDVVNHPSHYNDGKIEVMDFIEDKQLNFARGNVIKYVSRAGKKDSNKELEDLKKASWYLNREIERLNKEAE